MRRKVPAIVVSLCLGVFAEGVAATATSAAARHVRNCGLYKSLHARLYVSKVSCSAARRVVRAFLHSREHGPGIYGVPGYPRWKCSTGTASGECAVHGRFAGGVPEVSFTFQASGPPAPTGPPKPSGVADAPCSKAELEVSMRRAGMTGSIPTETAIGCEGEFPYAYADESFGGPVPDAINVLFRASAGTWTVVSRGEYCSQPIVPQPVKQAVCYSG
jgi:hypothetical protein